MNFSLEALEQRGLCDVLVSQSEHQVITIEGPLIPSNEPIDPRIEQLSDLLRNTPIWFGIRFTINQTSNPPAGNNALSLLFVNLGLF